MMRRANVSTVMKEGVEIRCKAVTEKITVVGLLVESIKAIEKSKGFLEEYSFIS